MTSEQKPEQVQHSSVLPYKTLRDEFAMAALTGMLADPNCGNDNDDGIMARAAYGFADAMMAERAKS